MPTMLTITLALAAQLPAASTTQAPIQQPIRTLIITGHNNHNWQYTSRVHKDTLEATGRFTVDITDTPHAALAQPDALKPYQLIVLDYNDMNDAKRWGDAAERNFVDAVRGGVGVVAIHSANNAFEGWTDYEKMLGLMWRQGTGHGKFHPFNITITDHDHPITSGLGDLIDQPDELYHHLVNCQHAEYHLLAKAYSTKESGGTGEDEPMAFTLQFGKGRIFATPLGHVGTNVIDSKPSIVTPGFKILICRAAEWAATGNVTLGTTWQDVTEHNRLSNDEHAQGWKLLFDGQSTANFRGFKQKEFPEKGWIVKDGALCHLAGQGGGDIITTEEYGDFEFACDWKVAPGGNSGIIYRCTEDHDYPWETGPEMQILDDARHNDGKNPKTRAGTLYALVPCAFDVARPAGEWNHARIVLKGSKVEHWLNGFKVVECDLNGDDYKKLHDESKFVKMPDFGKRPRGHVALQDHGDDVSFRAIKVRRLD